MTEIQSVNGVIKTKGLENYLVASVKVKKSPSHFWEKFTVKAKSLAHERMIPLSPASKQQPKKLKAREPKSSYVAFFEYEKFSMRKQIKLNFYSIAVSLFTNKTYSQVFNDQIKEMNKKIVSDIANNFVGQTKLGRKNLTSRAKDLIMTGNSPPTRLLVEAMVDDFKKSLFERTARVNAED